MLLQLQKFLYMMRAGRRGRRRDGGGPTVPQLGKSYITLSIIAVNLAWFVFEIHNGFSTAGLMKSGAADYNDVVLGDQWWRIVTAMFVHAGYLHILSTMIALAVYGRVEVFVGRLRYLVIYAASGISANLAELLVGGHKGIGLGATGAIMGVFGIAIIMSLHGDFPRERMRRMLIWIAVLVLVGVATTGGSNVVQITGLFIGVGATEVMVYRWTKVLWTAVIGTSTLLVTLGLTVTVAYGGTKSIQTSITDIIQDYNQLKTDQDSPTWVIQNTQDGQITTAYGLQNLQGSLGGIETSLGTIRYNEKGAAPPMRIVFNKLYQSESELKSGVQVLIAGRGKMAPKNLARAQVYFNESNAVSNTIYPLVKPYGVIEYH